MLIVDARVFSDKNVNTVLSLLKKELPSKVVICGKLNIDQYFIDQMKESGINFISSNSEFAAMAGLVKQVNDTSGQNVKVYSEDPLSLSLLTHSNVNVISPTTRKNYSVRDVEKTLKVSPDKVIDLLYIIGSKNSEIGSWLPESPETAADWLLQSKSIVRLVRDEHSPAKSNPLFHRRTKQGAAALERRQDLFSKIKNFKVDLESLSASQEFPTSISIGDKKEDIENSDFSVEKLADLIESARESGDPISVFVKENVSPSFLSGNSDRLEMLITDSKGRSILINKNIDDVSNRIALDLLANEIDNDLFVCTNNGKALFKAAFFNKNGSPRYSKMPNVHDVNVMAFSLDNRNQKASLNKLHAKYKTNDISDQGMALISLCLRLKYHFSKPENEFNYKAYLEQEQPLVPILARMEVKGLPLNKEKMKSFSIKVAKKRNAILKQIKEIAFDGFSPDKNKDVIKMLYSDLKLPIVEKTPKGDPSTKASVLEKLKDKHEFVGLLQEYRKYNTIANNSIEGFENFLNPHSNRIHCNFEQTASQNGRLSTTNPNIQGIPSKSELADELKTSFSTDPDKVFVTMDYQQAEIYVLASLSGCSKLQNVVLSGEDIHIATASQIFNCGIQEVTEAQRSAAKAINFGIVYGMSEYGMSERLGIPVKESREIINKYFETYPTVKSYLDSIKEGGLETGFVMMKNRRRIYIEGLDKNADPKAKASALRSAINSPMQGTAADLVKKAMIRVSEVMHERGIDAEICSQVHDELVIQCNRDSAKMVAGIVQELMTESTGLSISPKVDIEIKSSLSKLDIVKVDDDSEKISITNDKYKKAQGMTFISA